MSFDPIGRTAADLRHAVRQLRASPGFAWAAILTLALGAGANAVGFSVLRGALLRRLPFADPDRLAMVQVVRVNQDGSRERYPWWSWPQYRWLRERAGDSPLPETAVYDPEGVNLTDGGEPIRVRSEVVSGGYFELLGVRPAVGRTFAPAEDSVPGRNPVVILGHDLWRRRFAGDPSILGRSVRANGVALDVVGVMPAGFGGVSGEAELWIPAMMAPLVAWDRMLTSTDPALTLVARLPAGRSAATVQAAMQPLGDPLRRALPDVESADGAAALEFGVRPLAEVGIDPARRRSAILLFAAVWLVLGVACVNLAALQLGRSQTRAREFAVREALGCRRARLLRQLLTESLVLAAAGGAVSLLLALGAGRLLRAIAPVRMPGPANFYARVSEFAAVRIDGVVLLFALAMAWLTAVLVGVLPVLGRRELGGALRTGVRASSPGWSLRRPGALAMLTAIEIALAVALATGAGLLIRSFDQAKALKPGFDGSHVITFRIEPADPTFSTSRAPSLITPVLDAVRRVPGVVSATVSMCTPFMATCGRHAMYPAEPAPPVHSEAEAETGIHYVASDHFSTLRIPLREGRAFSPADRAGAPRVAIVNEAAARRFWPGLDPVGQRLVLDDPKLLAFPDSMLQVVGVVGDVTYWPVEASPGPDLYLPYLQFTYASTYVMARTSGSPLALVPALRAAVRSASPDLPVEDVRTMDERAALTLSGRRFVAWVLGAFAALSLGLAAVGVYGVASWSVTCRTREMGVRMALGAAPGRVFRLVLAQGMAIATVGLVAGGALAAALSALLRSQLYGTSATDPLMLGAGMGVVAIAAVLAVAIPAGRATRVEPVEALRSE